MVPMAVERRARRPPTEARGLSLEFRVYGSGLGYSWFRAHPIG